MYGIDYHKYNHILIKGHMCLPMGIYCLSKPAGASELVVDERFTTGAFYALNRVFLRWEPEYFD